MALLLCIVAGAALYLYWKFSKVVSTHRRQMNATAYSAQIYFDQREALLVSLRNSAVSQQDAVFLLGRDALSLKRGLALVSLPPDPSSGVWALLLTARDIQAVINTDTRLVYATPQQPDRIVVICPGTNRNMVLDAEQSRLISQSLKDAEQRMTEASAQSMIWLHVPGERRDRVYIFALLDPAQSDAGWLGLELGNIETGIDRSRIDGASYVLLDQQKNAVLHGVLEPALLEHIKLDSRGDAFGMYGPDLLPDYLALNKSVGEAGWRLVYYIPLGRLLYDCRAEIRYALLFCLLSFISIFLGIRHIRHKLITPALKQYDALLDMVSFSQTVIETAPVALCILRRADGSVVLANELTRNWFFGEADWQMAVLANPYGEQDREINLADGRCVCLTLTPTRYRGEEVLLCAFIDITAHKHIEESLQQAKRSAEEANNAKTLFLTTMSHELRTPLHGLLGALELFAMTAISKQQRMYLDAMQQSSSILLRAISDTLDISRIEAGELQLETTQFSPLALVEDVVSAYAAQAERKGLQIYALPDAAIPPSLHGDVTRIKQILNNFMSNAIKFTEAGQVVLRSRLSCLENGTATIVLQVEDTGKGIECEHLVHIFEPFYQVGTDAVLSDGTGLGLSICWRFAQVMGGTVSASSEVGVGTSFALTLELQSKREQATPDSPVLDNLNVYVHTAIPDIAINICDWLCLWGASARPYQRSDALDDGLAVLLVITSASLALDAAPIWQGPRLAASLSTVSLDKSDSGEPLSTHSIRNLAIEIGKVRRYPDAIESIHIKPAVSSLNLKILVVEDNPINRMILAEQLMYLGCDVAFANDGREGLNRLDVMTFDAILTDVNMPVLDGYAFASALRERGYLRPVFGITANVCPEDEQRCLDAGMTMVMTKPLSLSVLQAQLQSLLPCL